MSRRSIGASTLALPWPSSGERGRRTGVDGSVLAVTVVLALIGLVMVFSASAVVAGNRFHDSIYFLKRQLAWLLFGFLLLQVVSRLDYTVWRRMALPILGLTAVLLVLVLIPSLGVVAKGARRWLRLGLVSVQPAEMVKLVVVIYLAAYLTKKAEMVREFGAGLLPPLIIVGVLAGLVLLQPDLGTVVVIGLVTFGLLFLGGARLSHLLGLVLAALPLGAMLILESPYRRLRLMTFLAPWKDPADAGFQVTQSFLAFGSGGLFGVGLGEGKQKLFFLPEAHTDFVLALVGEELGLAGTTAIMVLYAVLVLKGFQIAGRAREPFGRHLALGIALLIGVQVLINAGVVTGLLPTKGLTLPLVSYGGSSLLVSLVAIGILLSVSRDRQGGRASSGYGRGIGAR
ncbi:MAG: putative lipid II flippase FtsW [Nitrospirae bacterium]|nr:putative lipid II flippase FtsW [Nitrospirota bacterium]